MALLVLHGVQEGERCERRRLRAMIPMNEMNKGGVKKKICCARRCRRRWREADFVWLHALTEKLWICWTML
jgi:hypothetical protein